jgi:16S rRNA (uracil1498-N3)-methyltransferase
VPVVEPPVTTAGLVARVADAAVALVLHEAAEAPLAGVDLPDTGEVLLVVGPEGGISAGELGELTAAGGVAVRLGGEVLRASTAGPAALAVLSSRRRWR